MVKVDNINIGDNKNIVLIAGPCVIESKKLTLDVAKKIKKIADDLKIPFVFKCSFDKANRMSLDSYRGPGLKKGLEILKEVKERTGLLLLSDVHCISQVESVAKVLDIIQIPAFLCRQTDLLIEVAKTQKAINIKKGQFMSPWDFGHILKKIEAQGNKKIIITERGVSFGYNNLVADFRALGVLKSFGYPVVFDATHSVQLPGGKCGSSGGQREFIPGLARAAVAFGCDGIFLEVHPNPENALCDGPNSLALNKLSNLLKTLSAIFKVVK
jgi:2-dehydro-3-deoxyphosphooctonate aldolase (KDO 8-P synthase)